MDINKVIIKTIFPVYISLTTIPSRINNTIKIIDSILSNVKGIQGLILNIPFVYKRWNTKISSLHITKLNELKIKHSNLIINYTEDLGPITKLIPSLDIIPNECVLLICDDDCYHHEAFKIIAEKQDKIHDKTFTFWKYKYNNIDIPQGVDIISFWSPNLYNLKKYFEYSVSNSSCFYVDDQVIGFYLNNIGVQVDMLDRKWKWPFIPGCFGDSNKDELSKLKGENERNLSMKLCGQHLR